MYAEIALAHRQPRACRGFDEGWCVKGLSQAGIRQQVQESSARTVLHSARDSQDVRASRVIAMARRSACCDWSPQVKRARFLPYQGYGSASQAPFPGDSFNTPANATVFRDRRAKRAVTGGVHVAGRGAIGENVGCARTRTRQKGASPRRHPHITSAETLLRSTRVAPPWPSWPS
jgi:hypothetical protein